MLLIPFIIFIVVLFIYLHIQYHFKTSNEFKIYSISEVLSKEGLEETCNIKQPVVFDIFFPELNQITITSIEKNKDINIQETGKQMVPLNVIKAVKLFQEDKDSLFYSHHNSNVIQKKFGEKELDYLCPPLCSLKHYDILFGSLHAKTSMQYHLNYRNYFIVTAGSVKIVLLPPLTPVNEISYNYKMFEFTCSDQANPKLEIILTQDQLFYIPAYWWYSIEFIEKGTSVLSIQFQTWMNTLAIMPYIGLHLIETYVPSLEKKNELLL
jgi:hypothetical protein